MKGLKEAADDDLVILSDVDEIPDLNKLRDYDKKICSFLSKDVYVQIKLY